jgi:hypothetical protein
MAVSNKLPSEIKKNEIDALINKGGSSTSDNEEKIMTVQLRLPKKLIRQIDSICHDSNSGVKISRHSWIVKAILESINNLK